MRCPSPRRVMVVALAWTNILSNAEVTTPAAEIEIEIEIGIGIGIGMDDFRRGTARTG